MNCRNVGQPQTSFLSGGPAKGRPGQPDGVDDRVAFGISSTSDCNPTTPANNMRSASTEQRDGSQEADGKDAYKKQLAW